MIGAFCRFYPAYTAEAVLAMPASRFFAMYKAMRRLQADERLGDLYLATVAAHPGEKGEQFREFEGALVERSTGTKARVASAPLIAGVTVGVTESDNDLLAEVRANREKAEQQRQAWLAQKAAEAKAAKAGSV